MWWLQLTVQHHTITVVNPSGQSEVLKVVFIINFHIGNISGKKILCMHVVTYLHYISSIIAMIVVMKCRLFCFLGIFWHWVVTSSRCIAQCVFCFWFFFSNTNYTWKDIDAVKNCMDIFSYVGEHKWAYKGKSATKRRYVSLSWSPFALPVKHWPQVRPACKLNW